MNMNMNKKRKRNKYIYYNKIFEYKFNLKTRKQKQYYDHFDLEFGKAITNHEQNQLVICQDCYPIILGIEDGELCSFCG